MWYRNARKLDWSHAVTHLRADPELAKIIDRVGACRLRPRKDYFVLLCLAIFNQQIAMKTAETLFKRFCQHFPSRRPTPERAIRLLRELDEQTLRTCGLSRQKRAYIADLAEHFVSGKIPTRGLRHMPDAQVIETLTAVK